VPAGNDDDDVAFLHLGRCILEVFGGNQFPVLLGDIQYDAVAEKSVGIDGGKVRSALDQMNGSIHMRAGVHHRVDPPRQHAVLSMLDGAEHLHIVLPRYGGNAMAPHMAEFHQVQTRIRICNYFFHNSSPCQRVSSFFQDGRFTLRSTHHPRKASVR
jgi:hypothetical protein